MPLPTLPPGYQDAVLDGIVRSLPGKWFHGIERGDSPILPLLRGLSFSLAHVRMSYENALNASIPMRSGGPWLSLHLQGIGLRRDVNETDAEAKIRYQWEFKPTRNTRAGELAALKHYLGLEAPYVRLESDRAAGRFGQFRIVVDYDSKPWDEVNLSFVGPFIRRYVSNGIIPSVDIRLKCLLFVQFPAWQFYDQFPVSWNIQGPIWERRGFINNLRLNFSRNLVAQVSDREWRAGRDRLLQLYTDGRAEGPGAAFLYLSDEGSCPYLNADYALQLNSPDINETFPPQPFAVDGFTFRDTLIRFGDIQAFSTDAPFFEVPPQPLVLDILNPSLPIPALSDLFPFPSAEVGGGTALLYRGLSFSQLKVTQFFEPESATTTESYSNPQLDLMRSGPWTIALTEGDPSWGNFPPAGSTLTGTPLAILSPESVWWTDAEGKARSWTALWDEEEQAVYFGCEFILPKGAPRTIREVELRLNNSRVHYRRVAVPIDDRVNLGLMFKVKGAIAQEPAPPYLSLGLSGYIPAGSNPPFNPSTYTLQIPGYGA